MRTAVLLGLVAACGASGSRSDLRVVGFAPEAAMTSTSPIEIRFDQPVGGPIDAHVSPAFAYRSSWRDDMTLVIEPLEPLAPSTRYEVALAGELGARTHAFHFSFVHQPLTALGVWGADPDALAPDADVPLSFDQPVRARDVAAHCRLAGDHAIALVAHDDATAPTIALAPAERLAPGAHYTLTCDGLTGAGGTAPMRPYALAVRARPPLELARFSPQGPVAPDEVALTFQFTTPVELADVRAAVSAEPAISGLDRGTLDAGGTTYTVTTDLDANTTYQLHVAGLTDRYGQRIAAPALVSLATGNARPRLAIASGLQVVGSDGLSVWSRDVASFTVDCASIPRDKLASVLAGADLPTHARLYTLAAHSTWQRTTVDPAEACGQPAGARGVFLATIHGDALGGERVIANATDLGVLVQENLVWVTSLSTGLPVAGARVTLVTREGATVHADLTNGDGLVKVATPFALAIVDKGSDLAVAETGWNTGAPLAELPTAPAPADPAPASAFKLTVEPHVAAPVPGAQLAFEVTSPVAHARVEWTLRTRRHAVTFDDFAFGTRADAGEVTADGTGTTDAQGRLSIVTRDPQPQPDVPVDYILTATVRDAGDRTATATAQVTAHSTAMYLGARTDSRVQPAGSPFELELVALSPSGVRRDTEGRITMTRVTRTCTPSGCDDAETPIDDRELAIHRGRTLEQVMPPTPGLYRVRIAADDALPVTIDLWATGEGTTGYAGDGIALDRASYRPGDTARIALAADLPEPTILLTIEHAGVVDARVIHLGSTAEGLEVAIARAWAPGVTVRATAISGGTRPKFASGAATFAVVPAAVD
ncbi:MAG: hypothetical protein JO257_36485 [Deltaproteobacteria bacterium]|nr:hypothetical protein [Deltaproteobacteria bacterium]